MPLTVLCLGSVAGIALTESGSFSNVCIRFLLFKPLETQRWMSSASMSLILSVFCNILCALNQCRLFGNCWKWKRCMLRAPRITTEYRSWGQVGVGSYLYVLNVSPLLSLSFVVVEKQREVIGGNYHDVTSLPSRDSRIMEIWLSSVVVIRCGLWSAKVVTYCTFKP